MAIDTDEKLKSVFSELINSVMPLISERAKKLLQEHINTDTYGINKTNKGKPRINNDYLNGTGVPSYEFRDKAWDIYIKDSMFSLFYDSGLISAPSANSPYLHGNYGENRDRRDLLPYILNVNGVAGQGDFHSDKEREPFWDNFEEEFKKKLGDWLYTEFNNKGLKIPSLKGHKFG